VVWFQARLEQGGVCFGIRVLIKPDLAMKQIPAGPYVNFSSVIQHEVCAAIQSSRGNADKLSSTYIFAMWCQRLAAGGLQGGWTQQLWSVHHMCPKAQCTEHSAYNWLHSCK
jgi:hypothetical protein